MINFFEDLCFNMQFALLVGTAKRLYEVLLGVRTMIECEIGEKIRKPP